MNVGVRRGHAAIALLSTAGCSAPERLPAVPQELQAQAEVPGIAGVRYRSGQEADLAREALESERRTLTIAGRAISSLIHSQGIGDLYRIHATTQRDGVDFNLARIPPTFNAAHKEDFDTEYMQALFDEAYRTASQGSPWE